MLEVRLITRMASNPWRRGQVPLPIRDELVLDIAHGAWRLRQVPPFFGRPAGPALYEPVLVGARTIKSGETLDGPGHAEPSKTGRSVSPGDRLPATWD